MGEVPENRRKANDTAVFQKAKKENFRLVSLTLVPRKMMEQLILEIISRHMKDKKIIGLVSKDSSKGRLLD